MTDFDPNHKPTVIHFNVGQKVVIFNDNNKILFLRRSEKCTRAGGWDFPGGGLEDEQPIEGIKREVQEEVGIEITDVYPTSSIIHEDEEPCLKTLIIGYIAQLKSGEIKLSWEHDDFKWMSVQEALEVDLPAGHTLFLKSAIEYFDKNRF